MQCDPQSYCGRDGICHALQFPGMVACQGGTTVTSGCNQASSADFANQCGAPARTSGCPYCRDNSCYEPICGTDADCHGGEHCASGLCVPDNPCPETVSVADVYAGVYGSGKVVCVRDVLIRVNSETDGDLHVRVGNITIVSGGSTFQGWVTEVTPQYLSAGVVVAPPDNGQVIAVHGVVRWDEGHKWYEMHPVQWIGP